MSGIARTPLTFLHDVVAAEHRIGKESLKPWNLGFLEFLKSPKFRDCELSISLNLLLSVREALRAWLVKWKRVLNARLLGRSPRPIPLPRLHGVVAAEHGNSKDFQVMQNLGLYKSVEIRKISEIKNTNFTPPG